MLSRREAIFGAVAGAAALVRRTAGVGAAAFQPATAVNFAVPAGACDCHTHIFGDPTRFPFAMPRNYTPAPASLDEMRALRRALQTERVVIVQPSVYGTDNACTLDAIKQLGAGARGVAVIDERTSDAALDDMDRIGIRGIRINLETSGQTDPAVGRARLRAAVDRVKGRPWHIQIYSRLSVIAGLEDQVAASPVAIVFDHFGGAEGAHGIRQPGFDALVNMVRSGKAYVKISAPYRISTQGPDYPDAAPLAKALIAANPQRILWGTDWPHPDFLAVAGRPATEIAPRYQVDEVRVFNQLAVWAPDPAQRKLILVDNPARLYRY